MKKLLTNAPVLVLACTISFSSAFAALTPAEQAFYSCMPDTAVANSEECSRACYRVDTCKGEIPIEYTPISANICDLMCRETLEEKRVECCASAKIPPSNDPSLTPNSSLKTLAEACEAAKCRLDTATEQRGCLEACNAGNPNDLMRCTGVCEQNATVKYARCEKIFTPR